MSNLYWLNDEEWSRIEPLLPRGRRGAHRVDDRRWPRKAIISRPPYESKYWI